MTVVELEPQTLWEKVRDDGRWRYRPNRAALDRVVELPLAKLMHGIGQPVGGSVDDPVPHRSLLAETADRLDAVWVSEHLSFNRVAIDDEVIESGFLLPPQQDAASVRVAAGNVAAYGRALQRPVAFETGVNYLRRDGDLSDGEYWRAVADGADCGILLDLHNLWCNELNGRDTIDDVLDQLPLERVWEVHLAGGMPMAGFWLDAHSGGVPPALLDVAAAVIPRLPNLGALMFEVLPEHVDALGLDGVADQLDDLMRLWQQRVPGRARSSCAGGVGDPSAADVASVREWELDLHRAVCGVTPPDLVRDADRDPGLGVYRDLIADARRGAVAQTMRYTVSLLLLSLGRQRASELVGTFIDECHPQAYRALEADQFARFLWRRPTLLASSPYLREVLGYEHALVVATIEGADSRIEWTADPTAILGALASGRLPGSLPSVYSTMVVTA